MVHSRRRRVALAAPEPGAVLGTESEALAAALEHLGDRWTLLVVAALLSGPKRFGELQDAVPGVASNILSTRLRGLERHGLVVGEPYSTRPLRLEYRATARASELGGVLRLLAAWASAAGDDLEAPSHALCGSALEVRHWCPTCQAVVDDDEEVWL